MPAVNGNSEMANGSPPAAAPAAKKKKTVEDMYQMKTPIEHILIRPDSYVGSLEKVTEQMWVFNEEEQKFVQREITYVPGLYKIFDEILVNAADNKQRDPKMDTIKITINPDKNEISVFNNGRGIPVAMHSVEKMYVPTMIFGHLLTSSNFDDNEKKTTGGRNGYGAKLCNIFSTKFTLETASKESKKCFKQRWRNNMMTASEPEIGKITSDEYTRVTFTPDLQRFKMDRLDDDIIALLSRRAYDVAASTHGVKVYLNNKRLPIKNFKDYVELYIKDRMDDAGNPLKIVHEIASKSWEIAITSSDKGFQNVSFVNSISTTKGGRHVDYVTNMVVAKITDALTKKNKKKLDIKAHQVKTHLWVFVNCLIENPTFDSQTKDTMTLQMKNFGSKCVLSDKFVQQVVKSGIVETVMQWAQFKQDAQMAKKTAGKKTSKLKGIPKLEDANDAGTRYSAECTLILTEGDSAKTLAVAGLGVIGRDRYGVFPLKGKLLNTREASTKQIMNNAEITNVIKILGLTYKKKYTCMEDLKSLRYGKLMIMTDQDQDGSHIKGLLINFIHDSWPSLLQLPFLEEFITPIVKASKAKSQYSFYSLPEFEEWKAATDNWTTYKIKYYKGLGTSTSKEAKEYFSDMKRHKILFKHDGPQDDHSILLAFSKSQIEQRKVWLTTWMEEGKRRKELGLPEVYLYEKNTTSINYSDFVNKELILFSNSDNERSIPCLLDGFKPGQRKVMFTCMKRADKREVKVAQLAGSIAEMTAYHHGEASLMSTIVNLAQDYVGSNNINLLQPIGQFGTRLLGGKDSASPRYIFTQVSHLTRLIYHPNDDPLLKYLKDDNRKIEPEWYVPIIPMVLVNGAEGIGTGWSTKVYNYNPRDIVANIRRMINNEEPLDMNPWFKNFKGEIDQSDATRYTTYGEVAELAEGQYEITELPIRCWTQTYKENVLETLIGGEKVPPIISEYREYNTDTTVRFVVQVADGKVNQVMKEGPHAVFKLTSSLSINSMVLFDSNGCLKRYNSAVEILKEFFGIRMSFYIKRKKYMCGLLEAEANKLSNQARFIKEKCEAKLMFENMKKKDTIKLLITRGYESDPLKQWKTLQDREATIGEEEAANSDTETTDDVDPSADFNYLMTMPMWNLTKEKKDDILKQEQDKKDTLEALRLKTPHDLWNDDLDVFLVELAKVEAQELEDEKEAAKKVDKKTKTVGGPKRKKMISAEVMPSPMGIRVAPALELNKNKKPIPAKKPIAARKLKEEEPDEFDDILANNTGKGLADRLGNSPDLIAKKQKAARVNSKGDGLKQTKIKFPKVKKSKPTSDSEIEISDNSDFEATVGSDVPRRERENGSRRAAATKVKYDFTDDDNSDASAGASRPSSGDDSGDDLPAAPAKKPAARKPAKPSVSSDDDDCVNISESDSDSFEPKKKSKPSSSAAAVAAPQPQQGNKSASDLFDCLVGSSPPSAPAAAVVAEKKRPLNSDSAFSDSESPVAKKKKPAAKPRKPAASKKSKHLSDSDDDEDARSPPKKVFKHMSDSEDDKHMSDSEDDKQMSDSDDDDARSPPKKAAKHMFDSDDDEDSRSPPKKAAKHMSDSDDDARPSPKKAAKHMSDSDDDEAARPPPKKAAAKKRTTPKKPAASRKKKPISEDEESFNIVEDDSDKEVGSVMARATTGRSRKPVTYNLGDSDDSGSDY